MTWTANDLGTVGFRRRIERPAATVGRFRKQWAVAFPGVVSGGENAREERPTPKTGDDDPLRRNSLT
jgi:hypothetical protein